MKFRLISEASTSLINMNSWSAQREQEQTLKMLSFRLSDHIVPLKFHRGPAFNNYALSGLCRVKRHA